MYTNISQDPPSLKLIVIMLLYSPTCGSGNVCVLLLFVLSSHPLLIYKNSTKLCETLRDFLLHDIIVHFLFEILI